MINFIANGKAGNGRTKRAIKKISKILDEKGVEYKFYLTEHPKHATEIARQLTLNGEKTIVAVGGDGTVHEVLNGLENIEDINFGILPLGSGNDFVTSAKIPRNLKKSLDLILNGCTKPTDFLVCDGIRGLNVIGTGIDVEILRRCLGKHFFKGKLKYIISTFISAINFHTYNFKYENNGETLSKHAFIIACCNGTDIGGGIPICPVANPYDGKMEIVIINMTKKSQVMGYFVKLMMGRILKQKATEHFTNDTATAVFDKPISIEIDGEIYDNLKFDIHIEKGKLNLFRP